MQIDKVPLNLRQLDINGHDIEALYPDIPKTHYSQILTKLLHRTSIMPEMNRKDILLKEVAVIEGEL